MSAAGDPADCPHGHADTVKLLSTVALAGRARATGFSGGAGGSAAAGGGCCGGACGCAN